MTQWISDSGQVFDTQSGTGIFENGTYILNRARYDKTRPFVFGAMVKETGHTGTVQLFADVLGVRTLIGDPLTPTFGNPKADPYETSLTGERGILVTGIVGTIFPEVQQ